MIYEIYISDIPAVLSSGASVIVISADSSAALVHSTNPIECVSSYAEDQLSFLLSELKWRQPCKDCEV